MSRYLKSPTSIIIRGDGYFFGRRNGFSENLWPFYETDIVRVIDDILATDEVKIFERFESIEIKMIDIFSVFLIVRIGRTADDEGIIMKMRSEQVTDKSTLATSKITYEKYSISRMKGKNPFRECYFENIIIYVKKKISLILHEMGFCVMLACRIFIIHLYANKSAARSRNVKFFGSKPFSLDYFTHSVRCSSFGNCFSWCL